MIKGTVRGGLALPSLDDVTAKIDQAIASIKPKIIDLVIDYAKKHHKFTNRSYNLQDRSLKSKDKSTGDRLVIEWYIDLAIAPYGGWITEGKRVQNGRLILAKNGQDQFIVNAVDACLPKIHAMINEAIERATRVQ